MIKFVTYLVYVVAFGLVAALLEGLPIIGIVFEVSNRIGAAMWAYGMCGRFLLDINRPHKYTFRDSPKAMCLVEIDFNSLLISCHS